MWGSISSRWRLLGGSAPLLAGLLFFLSVTVALPAAPTALSGLVLNPVGKTLAGVRILISSDSFVSTLWTAITDQDGRYEFTGLPPGPLQVAAAKPGYQVRTSSVTLLTRSSLDLILQPLPGSLLKEKVGETPGLSWILRSPTADILRDLQRPDGPGPFLRASEAAGTANPLRREGPIVLAGEVVHMEGGMDTYRGDRPATLASAGRGSRVLLRGGIGNQLDWHILGDFREGEKSYSSRGVNLGVNFAPTAGDDVSIDLQLARSSLRQGELVFDPFSPMTSQERTSWGYDARWSRELDPLSGLAVRFSFLQGRVQFDDASRDLLAQQIGKGNLPVDQSSWDAGGRYSLAVDDQHRLLMGMRTRLYHANLDSGEGGVIVARGGGVGPADVVTEARQGWDLDLFGEDHWTLSEPFEIISSLAYSRSDPVRGEEIFVPMVIFQHSLESGTIWNAGLLVAISSRGAPSTEVEAADSSGTEMGYLVGLSQPLPHQFHLDLSARFDPATGFSGSIDEGDDFLSSPAIQATQPFLGQRGIQTRELELEVEKRFRHGVGRFRSTLGEAEGQLAVNLADTAPLLTLNAGTMRYVITRFHTVLNRSQTEFQVGFKRVSHQVGATAAERGTTNSYAILNLLVAQRLAFMESLSRSEWKVVLAYQDVTTRQSNADLSGDFLTPTFAHSRLSGGIEIRF